MEAQETMERMKIINGSIARMAAMSSELIKMPKDPWTTKLMTDLKETHEQLREWEQGIGAEELTREELYAIGKILGRLEAVYGILFKSAQKVMG